MSKHSIPFSDFKTRKNFELVNIEKFIVSHVAQLVDWSKCVICQSDKAEKLTCPGDFADRFNSSGYKTLANQLQNFNELGLLPKNFALNQLDDGDGIEVTFCQRNAKFHKMCSNKFNKKELDRAKKRKFSNEFLEDDDTY